MPIEFKRMVKESRFLDPRGDFEESSLPFEIRTDPLTGEKCVICEYRWAMPEKPDLSELISKSLERGCPFCPQSVDKVTPKFPRGLVPEGRIHLGEAWVIHNIMPYAEYSAITTISNQHFIGIADFTEEMLTNSLLASQIYLSKVFAYDSKMRYCSINWNYMPLSGAGQLHPHLQIIAGEFPSTYQQQMLDASQRYYEGNSTNFWSDLIAEEKKLNERYLGTIGNTQWLVNFTSRSWVLEVMTIFQGKESILMLSEQDFNDFAHGINNVLKYLGDQNFYSFNLALYSGLPGGDYFWVNSRIVPRFLAPPLGAADTSYGRILHDWLFCFRKSEDICGELEGYFR